MATKYTKTTWVNGSAPAVSAANLNNLESGIENVQGVGALQSQTTATNNVAIGYRAMVDTTYGSYNTAIGDQTLESNTIGTRNVAVGFQAIQNKTSSTNNVAIGYSALESSGTGSRNVAIGDSAGTLNSRGVDNVYIGYFSGNSIQAGSYNAILGSYAGKDISLDSANNVIIGYSAVGSASSIITGTTIIGYQTAKNNTANDTTAIGIQSCLNLTSGLYNTSVGAYSLYSTTASTSSTAIGYQALFDMSSGYKNTAIGLNALTALTTYYNCTGLGAETAVTGNNQVQLGNSATTTYAYGAVQNRSDERDKADIRETVHGLAFIEKLRPVDYKWNYREFYKDEEGNPIENDGSLKRSRYHHGLIAQDVKKIIEETGIDFGGFQDHSIAGGDDVLSIGYTEFIAPMIKAIQELSAEVKQLKAQLAGG